MHRVRVGLLAALAFGLGISLGPVAAAQVRLLSAPGSPQVQFACGEIRAALKTLGQAAVAEGLDALAKDAPKRTRESIRIVIAASPEESRSAAQGLDVKPLAPNAVAQAYAIRKHSVGGEVTYAVLAADATGAMYGGLDLAEALRLGTLTSVADSDHAPFIANRGIKFNIPLDARTPELL
jgi:hypothetical protein